MVLSVATITSTQQLDRAVVISRGLLCFVEVKPPYNWSCTKITKIAFAALLFCLFYRRLTGQQMTEMDIESLQHSERRRGGCWDVFLVTSITFLFIAVTVVAASGVIFVMDLRSKVDSFRPSLQIGSSKLTENTPSSEYKMQNFAYLEANSSKLRNHTMRWASVKYGTGNTVGNNFIFDTEKQSLEIKQAGTYFMYMDLSLTCTGECTAGLLTVQLSDKLTCQVQLPAADPTPVSKKCWTVNWLEESTQLLAQMTVPKELKNWKLELNSSKFGMFLVD
ncbi:hypothetical protein PAMA_016115 [Pampus argenteus]